VPAAVFDPTVNVRVEVPEPGAAIDAGLKAAVVPVGSPDAVRAMAESKFPETAVVMEVTPFAPGETDRGVGAAAMVNAAAVTVRDTVAVCANPPPVPVTVTE
jgi:hypothetical protein